MADGPCVFIAIEALLVQEGIVMAIGILIASAEVAVAEVAVAEVDQQNQSAIIMADSGFLQ